MIEGVVVVDLHGRVQIANAAALAMLAPPGEAPTSVEHRLADLLANREVLAYTTDPQGLKRFARALRGLLLTRNA